MWQICVIYHRFLLLFWWLLLSVYRKTAKDKRMHVLILLLKISQSFLSVAVLTVSPGSPFSPGLPWKIKLRLGSRLIQVHADLVWINLHVIWCAPNFFMVKPKKLFCMPHSHKKNLNFCITITFDKSITHTSLSHMGDEFVHTGWHSINLLNLLIS